VFILANVLCFFDGSACPFGCSCLSDLLISGSVVRCSRFVFSRRVRVVDKPLDKR
jgi:hypothetical protein